MDTGEVLSAAGFVVALSVLAYCSVLDWRTRKVPNIYWLALSLFGLVLLIARIIADEADPAYLLVLVPIFAVLSDIYLDREGETLLLRFAPYIKYGVAIVSILVLASSWGDNQYFQHFLAVPVMMLIVVVLYITDVIRGGADAKALVALSIVFPFYPHLGNLPVIEAPAADAEILFPFAFTVLVNAAIIVAVLPLFFLAKNLVAHEFEYPQGLLGYKLEAKDVVGRHVWLMERIDEGRVLRYVRPRVGEDLGKEVDLLNKAGVSRIWVTPKLPFIIPIAVSVLFSTVIGELLFLLIPSA